MQSIAATPIDATRHSLRSNQELLSGFSLFKNMKTLYRKNGFLNFYRMFPIAVVRDSVGLATFFGSFEYLKLQLTTDHPSFHMQNGLAVVASGGIAGMAFQLVYHPIDLFQCFIVEEIETRQRFSISAPAISGAIKRFLSTNQGVKSIFKSWFRKAINVSLDKAKIEKNMFFFFFF